MTDLDNRLESTISTVFSTEQITQTTTVTELQSWCTTTGLTCCSLIVNLINSEPHITNICNKFMTPGEYTYRGKDTPSSSNHIIVKYNITNSDISDEDHIVLSQMDDPNKAIDVAKQITQHINSSLKVTSLCYTYSDNSPIDNKNLFILFVKKEDTI